MQELHDHPEAEVDGEIVYAKEILAYLAEQVKKGSVYDDDCSIIFEEHIYDILYNTDRFGKKIIEVLLQKQEPITKMKSHKSGKGGHLKRIK
jgi:hypothetical protein